MWRSGITSKLRDGQTFFASKAAELIDCVKKRTMQGIGVELKVGQDTISRCPLFSFSDNSTFDLLLLFFSSISSLPKERDG